MMYVFLGKNVGHNVALTNTLNQFNFQYELFAYTEIDQMILEFFMMHSSDCFDFLTDRLKEHQYQEEMTYSEFCQLILSDVERYIKFPLVIKDDTIHAGLINEELRSVLLPKKARFILSQRYLMQSHSKGVRLCG